MAKTLLLYASVYGHTHRIGEHMRKVLERAGESVEIASLNEPPPNPANYDRIIIGASIRNGKHNPRVHAFIREHRDVLDERPSAFFSVNLVARKPAKNTPETNPYVRKFMEQSPWKPDLVGVFAGDLDYGKYGFFDRNMIRFIMWLTHGPTNPDAKEVFTDWNEVERFAERFIALGAGTTG